MANQMLDLLSQHLGDDNFIDNLSQQIGGADREQTRAAANGIVTALSSAAEKTASAQNGLGGLLGMLDTDGDGSIFDNVIEMVSGGNSGQQQNLTQTGGSIVNGLLGNNAGGIINMISKMAGLDSNKTGSLMTLLAPMVIGALFKGGQNQGGGGLDFSSIMNMLQGTKQQAQGNPALNMITSFLDKDGDGDFTDDVIGGLGGNLLGGLFGKR